MCLLYLKLCIDVFFLREVNTPSDFPAGIGSSNQAIIDPPSLRVLIQADAMHVTLWRP